MTCWFLSSASIALPAAEVSAAAHGAIILNVVIAEVIPSNFIKLFLDMNMIQLIFMAIICDVSAGAAGEFAPSIRGFFNVVNELFLKVTGAIIKFVPVGIFCSILSLCLMPRLYL